MSEQQQPQPDPNVALASAQQDLLWAGAVAAVLMVGAALLAPADHIWGVAVGALIALANLSVLARIGVQLLAPDPVKPSVAMKAVAKLFVLMFVVVAVLYTRPHLALGLCIGLALPAVAGLVIMFRGTELRAQVAAKLKAKRS